MHTGYFRTKYWCALIGHTLLQKKIIFSSVCEAEVDTASRTANIL